MGSVISHLDLEAPDWSVLRAMDPEPAAKHLSALLSGLDRVERRVYALRGMCMLIVEERELYRWAIDEEVGDYFQSFDRWLKQTCPESWSYCRQALNAVKELRDLPFEDLLHTPRCNIEQLKKVSSNVRQLPEVVKAAQTLPEREFVSKINEKFDQHLEVKRPVIMATEGDCEELEKAIKMAMDLEQAETRADALKCLAVNYIQDNLVLWESYKEHSA